MLKQTVTYTNIDDIEVQEDLYFHLSKADLIEMQFAKKEGLEAWLGRIGKSTNPKEIIEAFKELVERAYGVRSDDGKFIKNPLKTAEFMSSEAYSEFFVGIVTDARKAAEFMNGIVPKGLDQLGEKIEQQAAALAAGEVPGVAAEAEVPALAKAETALATEEDPTGLTNSMTPRVLTSAEVAQMDADELKSGLATGRYKLS